MGLRYNPFSGSFDFTRSPGSYLDGEVATFADLPLDTAAAPLNSAWLVREGSGLWLLTRKPAGIYIRTATGGTDRNADYTYASAFPDVFSDANLVVYNDADSTKNVKLSAANVTTGTTRTLTVPDKSGTLATTDAGDMASGTLADARLSSNVPLKDAANTFTQNQTLNGTNNVAPNQTAASGSSLMTRSLADARFSRWENTQEIDNFTGATAGVVSGGSTGLTAGRTQLRGAASGAFRSIRFDYRGSLTSERIGIDAGAWKQRVVLALTSDPRCFAAWYPVLGNPPTAWSGRAIGFTATDAVYGYWLYRDDAWRAIKATFIRGSGSVLPVRSGNVITVTTNGNHNLVAGDFIALGGASPQGMQTYRAEVTTVPTSTTFTYANTGSNETSTAASDLYKIEELGSVATTSASNLFTGTRIWDLEVAVNSSGGATFTANGTVVATGSGFYVTAVANIARAGFALESLSAATGVTDLSIFKWEHTINP